MKWLARWCSNFTSPPACSTASETCNTTPGVQFNFDLESFFEQPDLATSSSFMDNDIKEASSRQKDLLMQNYTLYATQIEEQEYDRSMFDFVTTRRYFEILTRLSLWTQDLRPSEDTSLSAFNDSTTWSRGGVGMTIYLGKEKTKEEQVYTSW